MAKPPTDDRALRDGFSAAPGEVEAVLGRFHLRLVVKEALGARRERHLGRPPVDSRRYHHDDDGDGDNGENGERHLTAGDVEASGDAVRGPTMTPTTTTNRTSPKFTSTAR